MGNILQKIKNVWIAETVVFSVIVINTAALLAHSMCSEGSISAKISGNVDIACVVYFIIEAAIKIKQAGMRGYWHSYWNRFDFTIILFSLPVLLEPVMGIQGFATVLVLRLGRLFRLFRLMIFIPDLNRIFSGVARALRASIGVFVALMIFNVIFAIGATILFGHHAPEHFGNPFLSIYTTFKIFTLEGWYDIPDLIARRAESDVLIFLVRLYFVIVVIVGGILGLSIANAVFVDQMTLDNTAELESRVEMLTREVKELKGMLGAHIETKKAKRK